MSGTAYQPEALARNHTNPKRQRVIEEQPASRQIRTGGPPAVAARDRAPNGPGPRRICRIFVRRTSKLASMFAGLRL
jgi:hypothetical protein